MLTKDEYNNALDAHITAATAMAKTGHYKEAMKMVTSIMSLSWELTRPDAQCLHHDISYAIPDEIRGTVVELHIYVIVDEDGAAMMAWGQGKNQDGNDFLEGSSLPEGWSERFMAIIDDELRKHFGHLDMSKVTTMDEALAKKKPKLKQFTTTHVDSINESIDREVEKFSSEIDALFDSWGGDSK